MSDNSDIIRQANEQLLNQGRFEQIASFFCPDYCVYLTNKILKGGHEGIAKTLQQLQGSFADLHVEVEILQADDSRVS